MITILTILAILILSGLCSCSETALYSISQPKVQKMAEGDSYQAKTLLKIKNNMHNYISTIVFFNNAINIFGASFLTSIVLIEYGENWVNTVTAILTLLIIVFAEIIPKNLGESRNTVIAKKVAVPVFVLTKIMVPLIFLVDKVVAFFYTMFDKLLFSGARKDNIVDEAEIIATASVSLDHGEIDKKDYQQIHGILHLDDKTVSSIMTPASQLTTIDHDTIITNEINLLCDSQHSRILVKKSDDITGFIVARQALTACLRSPESVVSDLQLPIYTALDTMIVDDLLEQLTKIQIHNDISFQQYISIVKNAEGDIVGVVTFEDIQEEVFGQIYDESDQHIDLRAVARRQEKQKQQR
jgi:CBS domain containing-hemolysin-like protein